MLGIDMFYVYPLASRKQGTLYLGATIILFGAFTNISQKPCQASRRGTMFGGSFGMNVTTIP